VLHYFWKVQLDTTNPIYYGIAVGALLAARVVHNARKRQSSTATRPLAASGRPTVREGA
jgi:DMSO/TMAO reductase YedYZ heme-binding membrane subunit